MKTLTQLSVLLATGLGLVGVQRWAERTYPRKVKRRSSGVSGMVDESIVDEEPEGLEYDDRDPCHYPEVGMEGAPEDDVGYCVPPKDFDPKPSDAPFAKGGTFPLWPIQTSDKKKVAVSYQDVRGKWHGKWGRHFGTSRKGEDGMRRHVGVDLKAHGGDVVLAMEDGEVIAALPFTDGTWAVYVRNDSGDIVNYGEVFKNSWREFGIDSGVDTGQRVKKGQPIARVGVMGTDTSMLHLETLRGDTTTEEIRKGEMRWFKGDEPPPAVQDPTQYLVRAQRQWFESRMPPEPDGPLET